jgi:hypothetical protein
MCRLRSAGPEARGRQSLRVGPARRKREVRPLNAGDEEPLNRLAARLAGRSPVETPNYRLATEVRKINARLAQLTPEEQARWQSRWLRDWSELQRHLAEAKDDREARFTFIDDWAQHWLGRLS